MNKIFTRGFLIFTLTVFLVAKAFAIDAIAPKNTKLVTEISFNQILDKAREHSYDLKIADFDILIAKQDVRGAKSEYYPKLYANAGTEYTKNYRDSKDTQVMAIGESFINPYTRYQSILGVMLSYNLFDFGVRGGNLKVAKEEVAIKELEVAEKMQELDLNVLDTYTKILVAKKQLDLNKEILGYHQKNLEYKERLFGAREISKMELNDAKVKVEDTQRKIYELTSMMDESLQWLAFYTGEEYSVDNIQVSDIKKPDFDVNAFKDYTKTITWKIHEKQIKKKELELQVAKRANYPKISLYSRYYLYGTNYSSYPESLDDIKPSNFTVGGNVSMPLFDGFKNSANIKRTALELEQLNVERDKAIAQFMTRLATMRSNLMYLNEQVEHSNQIISELTDKEKSVKRLVARKISSPMDELDAKAELLEHQIELEKNKVTAISITKGIQLLTEENINGRTTNSNTRTKSIAKSRSPRNKTK